MTEVDAVRVEIYRSFIEESRAPSPADLAASLNLSGSNVIDAMRVLARDDVIELMPGEDTIWLAHPFCAVQAPFQVRAAGREWHAICIWDALGILAITRSDGVVDTTCPDCGQSLQITVSDDRLEAPSDSVVHYGVPARRWYEDVAFT